MRLFDVFRMALLAISRNKIRSFLTALGIVIGVASVIAMVHLGQAATQSVTERIQSMGSNLLTVRPGSADRGPGGRRGSSRQFQMSDVDALQREVFGVVVAPVVETSQVVVYGGDNRSIPIIGTNNEYFQIRNWTVASGRLFEDVELTGGASVCIIGATVVQNLFRGQDPLGHSLRVGRTSCSIIGVLEKKGASVGQDQDDVVVMPAIAVQRRLMGNIGVRTIYVSALVAGDTARVQRDIESILRERRRIGRGKEDDFNVRDMAEIAATLEGTTKTLTLLLGAIAAVSLLVGGIGIMNIMLVSVTERTREIGIRIAVGALVRDVLYQFLLEAITLSLLGGFVGVLLGIGGTWVATQQMQLPFVLSPQTMLIGFGFSALVGVVFGYFPARKAAHLNPIEALRHE